MLAACHLGLQCLVLVGGPFSWHEVRVGTRWCGPDWSLVWNMSGYRAELLAITVALASFPCVTVFCDNLQVVTYVIKLLRMPAHIRCDHLPEERRIFGGTFATVLNGGLGEIVLFGGLKRIRTWPLLSGKLGSWPSWPSFNGYACTPSGAVHCLSCGQGGRRSACGHARGHCAGVCGGGPA